MSSHVSSQLKPQFVSVRILILIKTVPSGSVWGGGGGGGGGEGDCACTDLGRLLLVQ